jgi:hypothetical protein
MAIPVNITTKTVTGKFVDLATGNASVGSVTFTPSFASSVWLLDPAATTTIVPSPVTIQLDGTGAFSTTLMCTNDPDASPINWTWHAKLVCGSLVTEFDFSLPTAAASPVDLSQVATTPTIPAPASNFAKSVNGIFPDAAGNITVFTVAPTILGNMSDVNAPTPGNLDILSYDLATSKWVKSIRLTSIETRTTALETPNWAGGIAQSTSAQGIAASGATKIQFPSVTQTFVGMTFNGTDTFTCTAGYDGPWYIDAQFRTAASLAGGVAIGSTTYADSTLLIPPKTTSTGAWGDVGNGGPLMLVGGQQFCVYFFNNTATATTIAHATRPAKIRVFRIGRG